MPQPAHPEENAVIVITKAGVVSVRCRYEEDIKVNQDDLLSLLEEELEKIKPKRDVEGKFAGRVTITVELLGDLEKVENDAKESNGA